MYRSETRVAILLALVAIPTALALSCGVFSGTSTDAPAASDGGADAFVTIDGASGDASNSIDASSADATAVDACIDTTLTAVADTWFDSQFNQCPEDHGVETVALIATTPAHPVSVAIVRFAIPSAVSDALHVDGGGLSLALTFTAPTPCTGCGVLQPPASITVYPMRDDWNEDVADGCLRDVDASWAGANFGGGDLAALCASMDFDGGEPAITIALDTTALAESRFSVVDAGALSFALQAAPMGSEYDFQTHESGHGPTLHARYCP